MCWHVGTSFEAVFFFLFKVRALKGPCSDGIQTVARINCKRIHSCDDLGFAFFFNFILPRIKCFPVNKRGVVVVADVISSFGLPDAHLGDEVSVHDDISEHRAGVALHGRPRSEEEKGKAAGKHPGGTITSPNFF